MSREQKIQQILDIFDKLTPENKQLALKAASAIHHESLKTRLRRQQIMNNIVFNEILDYYKTEKAAGTCETLLIMDLFNYGVMYGKRSERARRRGTTNNNGIMVDVNRRDSK